MKVRWVIRFEAEGRQLGRYYMKCEDLTGDELAAMASLQVGDSFVFQIDGKYALLKVERPKTVSLINGYRTMEIRFVPDNDARWMESAIYREFAADRGGWSRELGGGL